MRTSDDRHAYTFADGVKTPREYTVLGPKVWILSGIMVVLAIVTLVLILQDFTSTSYLYIMFYSIPANTAVSVFPHEPVVIYAGSVGNIWYTAVATTLGTVMAGYLDHSVFVPVMNLQSLSAYKDKTWYRKAAGLFMKYPFLVLVVTGFTPIPFFPFKFLSFSVHYPLWRYLAALTVGRFPRYVIFAWVGSLFAIPTWAMFVFFGAIAVFYAYKAAPKAVDYIRSNRTKSASATDASRDEPGADAPVT